MLPPVLRALVAAGAALAVLAPPAAAQVLHAHRGGSILAGAATYPENTRPAFEHAARREGAWLELDVKLTRDGVPVVLHDDTLDRTTTCTGLVAARTLAQLAECPVDVVGSPGSSLGGRTAGPQAPIPTLAEILAFARETGAGVNAEIKNQPSDDDFDPGDGFARRVMEVVRAAALPPDRLIVQSFWPPNLDVAERELPGVQTSFLTLRQANASGVDTASARGYEWWSPGGVPSAADVARARERGVRVVPYTLNTPEDVRAAAAAGVDAIISDDVVMARRALGRPEPGSSPGDAAGPPPPAPQPGGGVAGSGGGQARPAGGDARPLRVTVTLLRRGRRTLLRRGGFAVRIAGPPGVYRVAVRSGRRTLARHTVVLPRAGARRALVRLTRTGRRALRGRDRLRPRAVVERTITG